MNWAGIGISLMSSSAATSVGGGSSLTAQPALSDRAFHFSADAIAPQTDNTTLASWTDSVASISMTDAITNGFTSLSANTKYRTSRTNSKPAVQFVGGAGMKLGRPSALTTALTRQNTSTGVTLFFVMANVGGPTLNFASQTNPQFFGTETAGNSQRLVINNDGSTGSLCGPQGWARFSAPTSGLQVIVVKQDTVSSNGFGHFFHNGNAINGADLSVAATENYLVGSANGVAAGGNNTLQPYYSSVCDMMEFGCYNRSLTYAEIIQLTKWAFDKYGAAYPWAGASNFLVVDGDSISFGTGSVTSDSPPKNYTDLSWDALLMTLKSRTFGTWSNLGVSGRTSAQMTASATINYSGLAAQLGIPVHVLCMEYYNQPDSNASGIKAFTAAVKSASSAIKIGTLDAIATGDKETNRASYNTAIAGDTNTDVKIPVSTDASVGTTWSGTYFTDNAHPNNAGHAKIRDFASSYYNTLNAL